MYTRRAIKKVISIATLGVLCLVISTPAFAYVDPGSGSAIIGAIIGFFVAAGMVIKTYWYKLKKVFLNSKESQDKQ